MPRKTRRNRNVYRLTDRKQTQRRRTLGVAIGAFVGGIAIGAAILFLPRLWTPAPDQRFDHQALFGEEAAGSPSGAAQSNDRVAVSVMRDPVSSQRSECDRVSVHDGDTFRCNGMKVRLVAASGPVDAPELANSPRCEAGREGWCDEVLAARARDWLDDMLRGGTVELSCDGNDRYGRALCRASVNGRDAGDAMVAQGLATIEDRWR